MTRSQLAPSIPTDPELPGARGLLEDDGPRLIGSFLEDRGWHLEEARPVQAMYRPGRSCLVRYRARAIGPGGTRVLTLCAETSSHATRAVDPPEGFAQRFGLFDPVERMDGYLVWAYPYDPSLPELPDAAWGPSVGQRVGDGALGVGVRALRYRPRRRGVFRYRSLHPRREWSTSFGKVIPSRKATRAGEASLRILSAGIRTQAPKRLGRQTLVVPEVAGRSLRELLVEGASLPSPERVARSVRQLAATSPGEIAWSRPSPEQILDSASGLILALLPGLAPEVDRVRAAVEGSRTDKGVLVHGDLYEAQVLVGARYSLALIDLDDVALGDPAMDAANFCAHLLVLALSVPAAAERLMAYRRLARTSFQDELGVTAEGMAWREALCVLQLAVGPFRVLEPAWPEAVGHRVRLAVRLLGA